MRTILEKHKRDRDELIPLLHETQDKFGCIPEHAVEAIAEHVGLSTGEIYGVVTFFRVFSLKPKGLNQVITCSGTACEVRGASSIIEGIERRLGLKPGETSSDGLWSFETVNCLGCCSIGPVVVVNGKYHGSVTADALDRILATGNKGRDTMDKKEEGL